MALNNSTKKFIVSNTCYALSEILSKRSESEDNEVAKNSLFAASIALKIAMNVYIVKGVFAKLAELNAPQELQEIVIDSPSNSPARASASLVNQQLNQL